MSTSSKPFSQACENNKGYILEVIDDIFQVGDTILEIGSGTAQHALHFASHLSYLSWQPAELEENMETLQAGLAGHGLPNILPAVVLNVENTWPAISVDGIFSANCLHIMAASSVELFFEGTGKLIKQGGNLCVYGPFKYNGEFTTPSNARFDLWLKDRNPLSGIRDIEWVDGLAEKTGFRFMKDNAMPANNQLIHWVRD